VRLTLDMLNAYEECPMSYKREFVENQDKVPTWRSMQASAVREGMLTDLRARVGGGPGATLEAMMNAYNGRIAEILLECEALMKPGAMGNFKSHTTKVFGEYLKREAPLIHLAEADSVVSRRVGDLELECHVDGTGDAGLYVIAMHFWKVSKRIIINDNNVLMAALITGVQNAVMIQLILRGGYIVPCRYNIYVPPEKMRWFERAVGTIAEAIAKGGFGACPLYRGVCAPRCCAFYYSCRGAVEI
jgi:hypothetical protein